jgi:DNA repair exonuclease SbcCD ATPase subunit
VKGALNGVDFSITRTKTFSKGSLAFFLGGEDLTTQSVKETQAAIDEKLGVGAQILARTMFHGQHAINELLEATDSKLKDELSLIVPLGFWQSAVSASRKKGRTAAKKAAELDGMHTVRLEDLEKLQQRLQVTEEALFVKEASFRSTESRLLQEIKDIRKSERPGQDIAGETLDSIEVRMTRAAESADMLESQRRATVEERNSEVSSLRDSLNEATLSHAASTDRFQSVQRDYDSSYGKVSLAEERVQRLEGAWEIDLSSGTVENLTLPATCPTCRQPLCDSSKEHSHEGFLESMQQDISSTLDLLRHAQASLAERKGKLEAIEALRTEKEIRLAVVRAEHENRSSYWEGVINDLDSQLWNAHKDQQEASAAFSTKARQMQQSARIDALDSLIKVERETVSVAQLSLETLRSNSESCESLLADIQSRKDEQINISAVMGELSDAFGQRGVQTFVMQNVVSVLQSLSQSYLDELSDGAQRLEFALDAGDRISRRAFVRGGEGEYKERPLASLSGGQWRRCSLSITLGFAELVARRGRLRPSLCVLDEPLTHLDRSGRSDVGRVLRRMLRRTAERHESNGFTVSTILIILQDLAAEELEESFDCIDEVIKNKGFSSVLVDERV